MVIYNCDAICIGLSFKVTCRIINISDRSCIRRCSGNKSPHVIILISGYVTFSIGNCFQVSLGIIFITGHHANRFCHRF